MTTVTAVADTRTIETAVRSRRSLEDLVDWLMDALFAANAEKAGQSAVRIIHEARRLRQAGDIDNALGVIAELDMRKAETRLARWAFSEWKQLVRRRFEDRDAVLYAQGTGRAAALLPRGNGGTLEVVAVLGMRWQPGKLVSARTLRGLRPI